MAPIAITCLGPLSITVNGEVQPGAGYRKATALLIYLAMTAGKPHPREHLAALFWSDGDKHKDPKSNLRTALTKVRDVLKHSGTQSSLLAEHDTVCLDLRADIWCDAAMLDQLAAGQPLLDLPTGRPDPATLQQARQISDLYGGDFLSDLGLHRCDQFDQWVQRQRDHYRQLAIWALSQLTADAEARGDYEAAGRAARRQLEIDRCCEEAHRCLMRTYVALGRRLDALEQYRICSEYLKSDWEAEPEEATTSLFQSIRSSGVAALAVAEVCGAPLAARALPAAPLAPPRQRMHVVPLAAQLNRPLPELLGHTALVAELIEKLWHSDARLVTLTGAPGVGKTRVGLKVAELLERRFRDGVVFVQLETIRRPGQVVAEIAVALGMPRSTQPPALGQLVALLRDRQLLLLLDTFDHVTAAAPDLNELLAGAPQIKVLVTSRAVLRLAAEHLYRVQPLALPPPDLPLTIETLHQYPALALLLARAQAQNAQLQLTAPNLQAAAAICHLLSGLPLALELAAFQCQLYTLPSLATLLRSRLDTLRYDAHDIPMRHRSLYEAIYWSYKQLGYQERVLFVRLAVFANTWTVEAAAFIWNIDQDKKGLSLSRYGEPARNVRTLLMTLLGHGLIQSVQPVDQGDDEPRMTMLAPMREYARKQLERHRDVAQLRQRHAEYYLPPEWTSSRQPHSLALTAPDPHTPDYPNIVLAHEWLYRVAFVAYATKQFPDLSLGSLIA